MKKKVKYYLRKKSNLIERKLLQKIFNINFTLIKRGLAFNYKGYQALLDKEVIYDILSASSVSPDEVNKLSISKDINLIVYFKDSLHCFLYDCFNSFNFIVASVLYENIIISSDRWVKDKNIYEDQFRKVLDLKKNIKTKFIYFKTRTYLPRNKITIGLRENLYSLFLNNFDELINHYQKAIKSNFGSKANHLLSHNNFKDIKLILEKNYSTNYNDRNSSSFPIFVMKILYKILISAIIKFVRKRNIYLVNTNMWSVGNILIENTLLNKDIRVIGCQHGAGYKERKNLAVDQEIYCPAFYKFVGFRLFKNNVSASQILNLKPINRGEEICYINGSGRNNIIFYQNECIETISKLSFLFKCSIRVHPKKNISLIQEIINQQDKKNYNLNYINIFKSSNKFESISNTVKVCIFDNPHNTLFWEAYSRGIKTILIYDVNLDPYLSKDFIKIFDYIINPSIKGWESQINIIKNFIKNSKNNLMKSKDSHEY